MKKITIVSIALIFILSFFSFILSNTSTVGPKKAIVAKVQVYYFHYTRRCHTCVAVEETAKKAVTSMYASQIASGEFTFASLNLDDQSSKQLAKKLGIGGQTLVVVSGKKKKDITSQGFMNSENIEGMKKEIKNAVDNVLKK